MFLKELYHHHKFLFWFCIVFIVGEALSTHLEIENAPFFLYGMYSQPESAKPNYTDYVIHVNGKNFDPYALSDASKEMIMTPLGYYDDLSSTGFHDPLEATVHHRLKGIMTDSLYHKADDALTNDQMDAVNFRFWLKYYMRRFVNTRIDMLEVYRATYQYDQNAIPELTHLDTLFVL